MIPAIPTMYKGTNFRSRLEARWARFFDKCEWPWQYEPLELNGWIPDFLLEGVRPLLVEIKPLPAPFEAADVISKMEAGCRGTEWESRELLLIGLAPSEVWSDAKQYDRHGIGLFGEHGGSDRHWQTALMGMYETDPGLVMDFSPAYGDFTGRMFGHHHKNPGGRHNGGWRVSAGWADAGNVTQWRRKA